MCSSGGSPSVLRLLLAMAFAGIAACTTKLDPAAAPHPERIEPSSAPNGTEVHVVISGTHFSVTAVQNLGRGDAITVDNRFRVLLGETELIDVQWMNTGTLRA